MALNNIAASVRSSMCDALVDAIDAGSGAGTMKGYTSAFAALLFTLTFSDPAFGAASSGVATANAISDDTSADATGTAAVLRIADSNAATVVEGSIGAGSGDLSMNVTGVTLGDRISCSGGTITQPSS